MTVESIDVSASISTSYAGPRDGARDMERDTRWEAARSIGVAQRSDGRRECGIDASRWPCTDEIETVRACPGRTGSPRSVGRSRTHVPNARALMRFESSLGPLRMQNTFVVRNSATERVIPVKRDMKKLTGC